MSMTIIYNGQSVDVFAREASGYIDMIVRADTKGYWQNVAEDWGLVDADGNPAPGVTIDHIGSVVLAPAILDAAGDIATPAVTDNRHHLNLRVHPDFDWQPFAVKWTQDGAVTAPNNSEDGRRFYRVTLIDPDTIASPSRIML